MSPHAWRGQAWSPGQYPPTVTNYLHFQAIPDTSLGYLHFCMLQAIKNWCQERSRNAKLSGTMHDLFSSIKNTCISSLFFWLQFCNQNWKPREFIARAGLEVAVWGVTYSIKHAYARPTVLCILPSTDTYGRTQKPVGRWEELHLQVPFVSGCHFSSVCACAKLDTGTL